MLVFCLQRIWLPHSDGPWGKHPDIWKDLQLLRYGLRCQRWTCGLPDRVQQRRRPAGLRSMAPPETPIVLSCSCWQYPKSWLQILVQGHRWEWKKGSTRLHRCRGDTLPAWNHNLLGRILLWRCHSLQENGCHKRLAYTIAFLLKCLACVHWRQQCPQMETAYSQAGSVPATGTLQWTRVSGRVWRTIKCHNVCQLQVPCSGH